MNTDVPAGVDAPPLNTTPSSIITPRLNSAELLRLSTLDSLPVITVDWATPCIPLQVGVYQGDPLSVGIFNIVMNTLIDTLQTCVDLGYTITGSRHQVNLLQYADDTCLLANSPASCPHLLNMVDNWLQWSGMKAKVPKCHSMALQGSSGRPVDPKLHLAGDAIPYAANGPVKFLGMQIHVPHDISDTKKALATRLQWMLERVDACTVTRQQNCVCTRLASAHDCHGYSQLKISQSHGLRSR